MNDVTQLNPIGKPGRHKWAEPKRFPYKTERSCVLCPITKVTRHEDGRAWHEFYRDGQHIQCDLTPVCEPVAVGEVAFR